jgi:hypothetical protein
MASRAAFRAEFVSAAYTLGAHARCTCAVCAASIQKLFKTLCSDKHLWHRQRHGDVLPSNTTTLRHGAPVAT